MQNLNEKWKQVVDLLEKEVSVASLEIFVKTCDPIAIKNDCLLIRAETETAKKRINEILIDQFKLAINEVFDDIKGFEILSPLEAEDMLSQTKQDERLLDEQKGKKFNTKYTFDSFVVGKSNQFVYAASRKIAENPNAKINPLYIYGGVGLGKTHLMHAIGNYISKNNPELKILYVTCEQFTNDYIDHLQKKDKSINDFREYYRNLDVLMIDDIQFIANKIGTQEEFFNTFNELYQSNKQIIIASDRPPKDIPTLSDRLKSRFACGLMQDIQTPDFETRVAILKKKAQEEEYNIDDEVINYLAEKIDTNIRELEGCLTKVCYYANLLGKKFATMEDALDALKDEVTETKALSPDVIIDTVCKYYNVSRDDLLGKKKNKEIVDPRQMCMYLITDLLDLPLASIGKIFGGKDHTTIIHARDKISQNLKTNQKLKLEASDIKSMIQNK